MFNLGIVIWCRYVSPEYAQTGMLNEQSDVYSFGILVMEVISGRKPIDYSRPPGEVRTTNLVFGVYNLASILNLNCWA